MLILHRFTPFTIALAAAAGFFSILVFPSFALLLMPLTIVAAFLLLARLARWQMRDVHVWVLIGTPLLLLVSAMSMLLFLESDLTKIVLAVSTTLLMFFFSEHLFTYLHLPATYQLNAIEHVSLVMNLVSLFFLSGALFGFRLFLQFPLYGLISVFFLAVLFILSSTLWVCKIEADRLMPYALGGSLIATELFLALAYLPSGYAPNAALLTLSVYLYLGITRAHFLQKLSPLVVRRYAMVAVALAAGVVVTSHWV